MVQGVGDSAEINAPPFGVKDCDRFWLVNPEAEISQFAESSTLGVASSTDDLFAGCFARTNKVFTSIPHVQSTRRNVSCARPLWSRTVRRTRPVPVPSTSRPLLNIVQRIRTSRSALGLAVAPASRTLQIRLRLHSFRGLRVSVDAAFETLPPSPNLDAAFGALAERFRSRPTFQSFVTRSSQSVNIHCFTSNENCHISFEKRLPPKTGC